MKRSVTNKIKPLFIACAFFLIFEGGRSSVHPQSSMQPLANHTMYKQENRPLTITQTIPPANETTARSAASPEIPVNIHADTIDGVIFTNAADKFVYGPRDTIRVRYTIKNCSMGTVLYDFNTSCQLDVQIFGSSGTMVSSLPAKEACSSETSRILLAPSAEKKMEASILPLKLKKADTLSVKTQMTGYPLSNVAVKVAYQAVSMPEAPIALEGKVGYKPALEFNSETKTLIIRVNHAQRLTISAFILTGKNVDKLSCEKFLAPGTHLISFKNRKLTNGIVIFKVEGNGFSETKTINLAR